MVSFSSNPFKSCSFYADEPEELANLQEKEWQPILQWFNKKYGILQFIVVYESYMHVQVHIFYLITFDNFSTSYLS